MQRKIRVLVADDHYIVRMGLVALLETEADFEIVGEAEDGAAAVRTTLDIRPDVVLMDLMMPILDGVEATRQIHAQAPDVKILILTTSTVSDDLVHALDAGAIGATTKSADNIALLSAIRSVAAGIQTISPEIRQMISDDPPVPDLTKRQVEILHSITRGLTNQEIAKQFGISPESVKDHINAIYAKLGAATRAEAVAIALRKHLLKN